MYDAVAAPIVPVDNNVPPVSAEYHLNVVPDDPFALNVIVPVPQFEPGVVPVIAGLFTVTVTSFDVIHVVPAPFLSIAW